MRLRLAFLTSLAGHSGEQTKHLVLIARWEIHVFSAGVSLVQCSPLDADVDADENTE